MEALYRGTEVKEGKPAYDALKRAVYGEISKPLRSDQVRLRPETADYLRRIISSVTGDGSPPFLPNAPYDGFTRDSYEEVSNLLGKYGHRYLGISGRLESLMPDPRRVRAMLYDEMLAEEQEQRKQTETNSSDSPLDQYLPEMTGGWEIDWPELEPFPICEEIVKEPPTSEERQGAYERSRRWRASR
jgi:hypothetical protein